MDIRPPIRVREAEQQLASMIFDTDEMRLVASPDANNAFSTIFEGQRDRFPLYLQPWKPRASFMLKLDHYLHGQRHGTEWGLRDRLESILGSVYVEHRSAHPDRLRIIVNGKGHTLIASEKA